MQGLEHANVCRRSVLTETVVSIQYEACGTGLPFGFMNQKGRPLLLRPRLLAAVPGYRFLNDKVSVQT
jgi:hypothetical protein